MLCGRVLGCVGATEINTQDSFYAGAEEKDSGVGVGIVWDFTIPVPEPIPKNTKKDTKRRGMYRMCVCVQYMGAGE